MVSDNLLQDTEPSYYLIKYEKIRSFTFTAKHWHSFNPLCEVCYCYYDLTMPPGLVQMTCSKFNPQLVERTNKND